ncbi:diguanylate cyclase [Wenzhouxiangella sp. XN201]|uniref:sensor domain-containing diguanylate cyclase n=1 Tax=Wenzhouxiangella sp. XN201 TaxID=2710755 RepID=UPI0013CD13A7|nr:diguanylate cyclase [Wenzhouxiangella sp. XN201]NEZ03280.1 diguanylate cyclase [Wenzhouxiangella sp. XN201]
MRRAYQRAFSGQRRTIARQALLAAMVPLIVALVIALAVYQLMRDHAELSRQIERTSTGLTLSQEMLVNVLDAQTGVRGFIITGDEAFLAPYREALDAQAETTAEARQAWSPGSRERELFDRFAAQFAVYRRELAEPMIALERQVLAGGRDSQRVREDLEVLVASGRDKAQVDDMKRIARDLIELIRARVDAHIAQAGAHQRNAQIVSIAGAPLAVVLGMFLVGALVRRIRGGLNVLSEAAERVAQGDFSHRVELEDSREFAQLANGFNQMAARLEERKRHSDLLDRLTRSLQDCQTSDESFAVAEGYVSKLLSGTAGALSLYRASRDQLAAAFAWPPETAAKPHDQMFEPGECRSLRTGYKYHFRSADGDPPCRHFPVSSAPEGLCIPMMDRGEVIGVLSLTPLDGPGLDQETRHIAAVLAETLALNVGNLRLRDSLRDQSIRDPLTGLYNRRFLDENLGREISRSRRTGNPLSVIVLDVDHFKQFNDSLGHDAGDAVLIDLARLLAEQARDMDLPCRLGGEEFLIVLPRASVEQAMLAAERLRKAVSDMDVEYRGQPLHGVTVSLGVASYPDHGDEAESLIKAADQALYRAKRAGRDRVERA